MPLLSDDEGIPFDDPANVEDVVEDQGSEEGEEEEYVVESINGHKFVKGSIQFHVKWQGYDDDADMTWEPEENLETAPEVLKEYYDTIGGRPQAPSGSKKRGPKPGAKRTYSESNGGTPEASSGRGRKKRAAVNSDDVIDVPRKKKDKYPPKGDSDWDKFVDGCDTIEVGTINHNGVQEKFALLRWEDGQITKNTLRIAHKCAPQAMLRFYESHLRFGTVEPVSPAPRDEESLEDEADE